MADHSVSPPPADSLKATYVKKPPKASGQDPCTEKPGNNIKNKSTDEIQEFQPPLSIVEREQHLVEKFEQNQRWSTFEGKFPRGVANIKRLFDMLPNAKIAASDLRPVPSSFKINGVYRTQSVQGTQSAVNV